jgi:hypothetical protein
MAETIGSLADKIIIVELKRFHMHEQTMRQDVTADHRQKCQHKLAVLSQQRDDLVEELNQLFQDVIAGTKTLNVYRQFKMYNDPVYRTSTSNKQ